MGARFEPRSRVTAILAMAPPRRWSPKVRCAWCTMSTGPQLPVEYGRPARRWAWRWYDASKRTPGSAFLLKKTSPAFDTASNAIGGQRLTCRSLPLPSGVSQQVLLHSSGARPKTPGIHRFGRRSSACSEFNRQRTVIPPVFIRDHEGVAGSACAVDETAQDSPRLMMRQRRIAVLLHGVHKIHARICHRPGCGTRCSGQRPQQTDRRDRRCHSRPPQLPPSIQSLGRQPPQSRL